MSRRLIGRRGLRGWRLGVWASIHRPTAQWTLENRPAVRLKASHAGHGSRPWTRDDVNWGTGGQQLGGSLFMVPGAVTAVWVTKAAQVGRKLMPSNCWIQGLVSQTRQRGVAGTRNLFQDPPPEMTPSMGSCLVCQMPHKSVCILQREPLKRSSSLLFLAILIFTCVARQTITVRCPYYFFYQPSSRLSLGLPFI